MKHIEECSMCDILGPKVGSRFPRRGQICVVGFQTERAVCVLHVAKLLLCSDESNYVTATLGMMQQTEKDR